MSEEMKEREEQCILRKYFMAFPDAWKDFLRALENSDFEFPAYEEELRCFLFASCLGTMRRKKFAKPYQIFAEDREISKTARPDITFGRFEDGKFVAVEAKHFPTFGKIREDIKKLQEYVKSGTAFGFFVMIGDSRKEYRTYLNLKELGIQQEISEKDEPMIYFRRKEGVESEKSFYQWKLVKIPNFRRPLETLLVGILG